MTEKDIIITKATAQHLQAVNDLSYKIFEYHNRLLPNFFNNPGTPDLAQHYKNPENREDAIFLVALKEQKVIGYLLALILNKPWQKVQPVCNIEEFGVCEAERHQGVGTALFDAIKKECQKRNVPKIVLNVYTKNSHAVEFYKKMGCQTISQRMDLDIKKSP